MNPLIGLNRREYPHHRIYHHEVHDQDPQSISQRRIPVLTGDTLLICHAEC